MIIWSGRYCLRENCVLFLYHHEMIIYIIIVSTCAKVNDYHLIIDFHSDAYYR